MQGKQLLLAEVAKLNHGAKVYVERKGRVTLEVVAKTQYSSVVRTTAYGRVTGVDVDTYQELTPENEYYEFIPGVNCLVPEITFSTIRYAVAHCKHKNDQAKRLGNPQLFPGIDEAYDILNGIAAGEENSNAN